MRKLLISFLLASAAASPALAQSTSWSDRMQARADRQQSRDERSQAREERSQARDEARSERSAPNVEQSRADRPAPQFEPRQQMVERPSFAGQPSDVDTRRASRDARRESFGDMRDERIQDVQQRFEQRQARGRVVDNPFRHDGDGGNLRQSTRPLPPILRRPTPVVSDTPQPGTQPPPRVDVRHSPAPQWSTNWRNNGRYDWQDYRRHHHSLFHIGIYYDPFGWGYSPYQIGWRLWPSYYSSNYWINDPWMYRLPYAPAGYVWIRYWDDALLVDTWTGQVVDVIPSFFW